MKNISKFQLIIFAICVIGVFGGVVLFATTSARQVQDSIGSVTLWGTEDFNTFQSFVGEVNALIPDANLRVKITYVKKTLENFYPDLVEALASGRGPDLILIPQDSIIRHLRKVYLIPYTTIPERTFVDSFVQAGELFMTPWGVAGVPFSLDPLVMYWNRDIFNNQALSAPPKTWEEIASLSARLTQKDDSLNISQSIVALGEYRNVNHAKEILSLMAIQEGSTMATLSPDVAVLPSLGAGMVSAVEYFIKFANPTAAEYSWNRSFNSARERFLSSNSALYFGFASEATDLRSRNPNLNFDVAFMPQFKGRSLRSTFAQIEAFAIIKNSPRGNDALRTIYALTNSQALGIWLTKTGLPPVRRDMLTARPTGRFGPVLYESALQSRAWLDPSPSGTGLVFQNMIESINSGAQSVDIGVNRANSEIGTF